MGPEVSIFWFRRDLRLSDNTGLTEALNGPFPVVPVFLFDPAILDELAEDDARLSFIHSQLQRMRTEFRAMGSDLVTFHLPIMEALQELSNRFRIQGIYTNEDYEPYARKRDRAVEAWCTGQKIDFNRCKDQVIFHKDEVTKADGSPYVVYTPYMKAWRKRLEEKDAPVQVETDWTNMLIFDSGNLIALEEMGFVKSTIEVPDYDISADRIDAYGDTRDIPAKKDGTSRLGPHLRFGTISVRQALNEALKSHSDTFLKELIWREFFMQILWHFPHTVDSAFKPAYDRINWRNNKADFEAWKEGKTGYPLVDAGMRELKTTGHMHNRVRMLVASFLCKHLLIDWRWGEAHFARHLLDFELSSNVGNWQWAAGSGVDAAPYFRIFNPMTQHKKFDPESMYVSRWVPEFMLGDYVEPVVEHGFARERCLSTYKAALQ